MSLRKVEKTPTRIRFHDPQGEDERPAPGPHVAAASLPSVARPTDYSPDLAEAVCRRIAEGAGLGEACADPALPSPATVARWILEDREGFAADYHRARQIQAFVWADQMLAIADETSRDLKEGPRGISADTEHIQRSKLRVDTRKWLISKACPRAFGEGLSPSDEEGGPLHVTIREFGSEDDLSTP